MSDFTIPGPSTRTAIVGSTGTGKTQFGSFILSRVAFDTMPWVIFDFKREKLFTEIELIRQLSLENKRDWEALNQPGIFIVRPNIGDEDQVEDLLWYIWEHENIGIFIDEGYMIGKSNAFVACLTQGRSKQIPMIVLSQRPAWITKFAFSEADYLAIFHLRLPTDRKTIQEYVEVDISIRLPEHWCYWYDVSRNVVVKLRPVPDRDFIISTFRNRLSTLYQARRAKSFV